MIACFAAPSFHEGSWLAASCASADVVRRSAGIGSTASIDKKSATIDAEERGWFHGCSLLAVLTA
jgi:hypothetical protein